MTTILEVSPRAAAEPHRRAARSTPAANLRANNLDAIRFVLASLVVLAHSYPMLTGSEVNEPLTRLSGGQKTLGGVAVDAFFLISGFLITASWLSRRSIAGYLRKRVARIYPGFVAMTLFCLAVAPLAGQPVSSVLSLKRLAKTLIATAVLEPYRDNQAFPTNPIPLAFNPSAWTIRYEFWCYLLLVLLGVTGLIGRRRVMLALAAASLACLALLPILHLPDGQGLAYRVVGQPTAWVRFAACFLTGAAAQLWRDRVPLSGGLLLASLATLAVTTRLGVGLNAVMPLAGGYVVYWLAFTPRLDAHAFARRGDFSYGLYLYACPIQQLLVRWFGPSLTPATLFLIAWTLSVLAGVISWFAVERHFLKTAHSRRPAIAASA